MRRTVTDWRRLSDRLFSVGPFGVGLDGLLTWIPAVGGIYGLGAGGFLLVQAARVKASRRAMVRMGLLIGADALVGEVPILGDVFDFVFRAHARSARILLNEMERTHYVEDSAAEAERTGRVERHREAMRAGPGKQRLVFLQA